MPRGLKRVNDAAKMLTSVTKSKETRKNFAHIFQRCKNYVAAALGRVKRTIRKIRKAPEVVKATRLWFFQYALNGVGGLEHEKNGLFPVV